MLMGGITTAGGDVDKQATRLSEGKSALGGLTGRRSTSRYGKENDMLRTSTEIRNQFGKDFENVSIFTVNILKL